MNNEQSSMNYINLAYNIISDLLKHWQIILAVTVALGLGYDTYKSISYEPLYCSSTRFSVITSLSSSNDSEGDVGETFTYIFKSNVFKKKIQQALGVNDLNGYYTADLAGNTNVLVVSAYSNNQKIAYDMMVGLSEHYQEVSTFVVGNTNIEMMDSISVPTAPCNAVNHKRNIILLSGIGFILSVGVIGCLSFLKNTIKDKSEIESKLHLRLLGTLPKETKLVSLKGFKRKKSILINQYSTSFRYIESVKRIRSRIKSYVEKHQSKVFMITSSLENEGKSSVSVNIALSFAENKDRVLLIDGDFRKPSIQLLLEQNQGNEVTDYFQGKATFEETVVHYTPYLDVLFGFNAVHNIQDEMDHELIKEKIDELRSQYDYIIIDSAPSRFIADSSILSDFADGIILVVKQNYAKVTTIQHTIDKLSLSKTPIIGCINNQTFSGHISRNGYSYRYGYNNYYRHNKRKE